MLPVKIHVKSALSNSYETINVLKIVTPNKIDNFELIESHFLVKLREHFLAIPREYWEQAIHLFDVIKF